MTKNNNYFAYSIQNNIKLEKLRKKNDNLTSMYDPHALYPSLWGYFVQ